MKLETLDNVVRSSLLTQRKTIHWYFHFLHSAIRCLRELNLDVMRNVKSVLLPVDANFTAKLPCDYVDYVRIGSPFGQYVVPFSQKPSISNLPNLNAQGQTIPYPSTSPVANTTDFPFQLVDFFSYGYYYWYLNNYNSYGENMGSYYGYTGVQSQAFKIIPSRNIIQLDQNSNITSLYLDYISDGFDANGCSCATMVSIYAIDAIEKYIVLRDGAFDPKRRGMVADLQKEYDLAVKRLVSRLNPLTIEDIRASFRKGYVASPKGF